MKFVLISLYFLQFFARLAYGIDISDEYIVWNDEFNQCGRVNPNTWKVETGGNGWGNDELQFYTPYNARQNNGNLEIKSKKQMWGNSKYTSTRIVSEQTFTYGYFQMRAKLPKGRGIWSAFWLLNANRPLNWPSDGEIDIMENVGFDQSRIHSNIHTERYNHLLGTNIGSNTKVDNITDEFHTYTLNWTPVSITTYVDDRKFFEYDKPINATRAEWPFDEQFNIILNVAVGGSWGGLNGVDDSIFPTTYAIDYVRQYENGFVNIN